MLFFQELWRNMNETLYSCYPFCYSQIWKVSLRYLQNWQNYAAFSHGNLAVETLSKIVSIIQDISFFWVNINAQNVFRHRSCTLVNLFVKLGTILLIGPAEIYPISSIQWDSASEILIQKLFGLLMKVSKQLLRRYPDTISPCRSNLERY